MEREYFEELIEDNKIHLSSMMSVLNRFINNPESESRIRELKKDKHAQQFMFVDEFQDTDDSQIESLLRISQVLDYKLFLVGDIKQCIYRFRGAKEKAFDQLGIAENPDKWLEFSLQRNYRTDKHKFSCHVLRHTFATRMCESGLNVKVVQSVLGHADVTTTLDIYVTVTNDLKKREITAFETYLKTGAKQMANV